MMETALREGSHFFEWTHRRFDGEEFPTDVLLTRMEQEGRRCSKPSCATPPNENESETGLNCSCALS